MRTVLTALFTVLLFLLGCWTPGDIQENLPKHREKFTSDTVFFVHKTEPRVSRALTEALVARGFKVTEDCAQATVAIETKVQAWEYNDAGFSGFYDRDEMTLAINLRQVSTGFVLARHTVTVKSDFRILTKYVDGL